MRGVLAGGARGASTSVRHETLKTGQGTYRAAELCAAVRAFADYAQRSRVALNIGADPRLAALLSRHGVERSW